MAILFLILTIIIVLAFANKNASRTTFIDEEDENEYEDDLIAMGILDEEDELFWGKDDQ